MSPTALSQALYTDHTGDEHGAVVEGCTRGSGDGWVLGGCYTGTQSQTLRMTIFSHIPASEPYPRPNEANSEVFHEVSQDRV